MASVYGLELIPQGTAYGLLIGLGVLFCAVILGAVRIQKLYLSEDSSTSEMFMVANRSVGTGLTASAVFSSWMWINETVMCAAMCYRYGLAVPLVSIPHPYSDVFEFCSEWQITIKSGGGLVCASRSL